MANPTDALVSSLTNLANDRRTQIRYYGNLDGLPGNDRNPRRLLSDVGFLIRTGFDYLVPSPANVVPESDQRISTVLAIYPFGIQEDYNQLTSADLANRRVQDPSTASPTSQGVTTYPGTTTLYMSATVDQTTYAPGKTAALVSRVASPRNGTSYHFIISRNGDILVVASIDYQCRSTISVDVAVEGALVIESSDWEARQFGTIFEAPYTDVQLTTLAVLFAKLYTALPSISRTIDTNPQFTSNPPSGLAYFFPTGLAGTQAYNFTNGAWMNTGTPFDHSNSDAPAFFANVTNQGVFNLATQVFRPTASPAPQATRAAARSAMAQADNAGQLSVILGAYADVAAPERSFDMQQVPRSQLFMQRLQRAHTEADHAGQAAGHVAEGGQATVTTGLPAATNSEPHTYNFQTGLWGDNKPY